MASSVVTAAQNPAMTSLRLLGEMAQHAPSGINHPPTKKTTIVTPNKQEGYKFGSPQITHLLISHIQPVMDIFPKGC